MISGRYSRRDLNQGDYTLYDMKKEYTLSCCHGQWEVFKKCKGEISKIYVLQFGGTELTIDMNIFAVYMDAGFRSALFVTSGESHYRK
jgi:hypothetical protein